MADFKAALAKQKATKEKEKQTAAEMGYVPPKRKSGKPTLCVSDGFSYTSNPIQNKCKVCGRFWMPSRQETPICTGRSEDAIPPCDETKPIPKEQKCQEASIHSHESYIACGATATAIVRHHKDRRSYYMCMPCADHNVRNRGGSYIIKPKQADGSSPELNKALNTLLKPKAEEEAKFPSATGLRFDELPLTSTFSRADMDEAIRLMAEDVEYADQVSAIDAERKKGKERLTELGRKYGIPGMRHGTLETRLYTEQRETLDKGLFVELGGDIDVLRQSYKKGKEYVKVVVKDTSRQKGREESD